MLNNVGVIAAIENMMCKAVFLDSLLFSNERKN